MPPPLDLPPPPPLIWPHPLDMVRFDLHVNHLVSLWYNIHYVYTHFSKCILYPHMDTNELYTVHLHAQFTPNISTVAKEC